MTGITSRWIVVLGLTLGFALFAVVDGLSSTVVRAVPLPPAVFWGNVTVAGSPAAGGIPIEARINGVNYAFSSTAANNNPTTAADGTYGFGDNVFQVLADDNSTSAVEGGTVGDTIAFFVGGSSAGSATFTGGSVTQLDLSVSSIAPPPPPPGPPPPPLPPPIILPTPTATPVAEPTPIPVDEVEDAPIDEAVNIIEEATVQEAAQVFEELTPEKGAAITEALSPELAAAIIEELTTETAVAIIELINPAKAAAIIALVRPVTAANIVEQLGTATAIDLIEATDVARAAAILDLVATARAAEIIEAVASGQAADILSEMEPLGAASVLEHLSISKLTQIVEVMPESKLIARLSHMPPNKLFQIPPEVLFKNMPSVPVEQLAVEVPPRADSDLPLPQIIDITDALATYNVPKTRAGAWAVLAQGRAPIDRILGKFGKDLSNVRVTLEDLSESVGGLPDIGPNRIVGLYFRVDVDDASPEDITVAHVTVSVEKDWIRSNGLHNWSIEFNRFDEGLNAWVRFPSKRVREEGGRAYYTAVVPGFSLIAVFGSDSLPEQVLKVTDLAVSPATPLDEEPFTVSVNVTNTGASSAVFPASLWLNDTVEAATTVAIEGGATSRVEFSLSKPTGVYRLRVDRSVMNLIVGVPPLLPTPTPVPAAPPAEPTATPVPPGEPGGTATPIPPVAPTPTAAPPVAEATATPVPTSEPSPPAPTATSTPQPPEKAATTTLVEAEGGGPAFAAIILAVLAAIGGIGFTVYMILVRRRMGRAY